MHIETQFKNQAAVMMPLLLIISFYFNDLTNCRLIYVPKSSFNTKTNPNINETIGIFITTESIANVFGQRKHNCVDCNLYSNAFNSLKKSIIDENKFFTN